MNKFPTGVRRVLTTRRVVLSTYLMEQFAQGIQAFHL